jgi:hypothetical protein
METAVSDDIISGTLTKEGRKLRNAYCQIRLYELFTRSLALVWRVPVTIDFVVLNV